MSRPLSHQGVIALAAVREYCCVADILETARSRDEDPFLLLCDEISDPQNLGAIIRTGEAAGVHGVIIPKRRSAGINFAVYKTSAGAAEHMPVARVANLTSAINELKKAGVWIYGSSSEASTSLWQADLAGPVCIVVGSEGSGIGRLIKENCDFLVSIPMKGRISSLNASAAAAVLIYETLRRRELRDSTAPLPPKIR
jgi:23S rRNA (guanosine2251-2'-O)-methyltransferase